MQVAQKYIEYERNANTVSDIVIRRSEFRYSSAILWFSRFGGLLGNAKASDASVRGFMSRLGQSGVPFWFRSLCQS